jgi:hydroxymethylglutaryl-CoA synthase
MTEPQPSFHPIDEEAAGISGMSLYVPAPRVGLEAWCTWTNNPWAKVQKVVGRSFRVPAPHENVYTMAANAVLRLIVAYDIDPERVGFLGLGTESSTDNAAGAVIVRGMVDRALETLGRPRLSRQLEVPEFKHACLGGVYALKSALRYVMCDGADRLAIVVSADVAEYERGSSGEQTQGAGAVAMLVERRPKMLAIDLTRAGSASDYRGPDFRKPFARHFLTEYASRTKRLSDFPVFSGRYSTYAYLDETVQAVEAMLTKIKVGAGTYYRSVRALFFHRPYHHMPISAMSFLYVRGLARSTNHRAELDKMCADAQVPVEEVLAETQSAPDLYARVLDGSAEKDPYPQTGQLAAHVRKLPEFLELLEQKMSLGSELVRDLGNLYSAALPAWIAAGFESAAASGQDLTGSSMVMVGYGSGDAAEAIPMTAVPGWQDAARKIGFKKALERAIDLDHAGYESLHDGRDGSRLGIVPEDEFAIFKVGETYEENFQDLGVEYYEYVGSKAAR